MPLYSILLARAHSAIPPEAELMPCEPAFSATSHRWCQPKTPRETRTLPSRLRLTSWRNWSQRQDFTEQGQMHYSTRRDWREAGRGRDGKHTGNDCVVQAKDAGGKLPWWKRCWWWRKACLREIWLVSLETFLKFWENFTQSRWNSRDWIYLLPRVTKIYLHIYQIYQGFKTMKDIKQIKDSGLSEVRNKGSWVPRCPSLLPWARKWS